MDLKELENRNIEKQEPKQTTPKEPKQIKNSSTNQSYNSSRSNNDWMLILRLSVILALLVGLFIGSISGFFIGKAMFQGTQTPTPNDQNSTNDDIFSQFDYSKIIINADKNVTVESFYEDDEEKFYAMQLIGTKLPELTYTDSKNNSYSTKDLGDGKYILEFIEPDCAFCNGMIETVDEYRAKENSINVIGLSIKSGDISAFNKVSETSFMLANKDDTATKNLVDFVVWVPTFMYIEDGTIKLVSYGRMNAEEFEENIDIAFN
jgi:hypothetical protein